MTVQHSLARLHKLSTSAPALFCATLVLALTFWLTSGATAGTPGVCQVCHKQSQTFTFPCASVQYAGHKAHGDPDGPCGTTTSTEPARQAQVPPDFQTTPPTGQ